MRNIRILVLDGGGIRGIFSTQFMINFCTDFGITDVWKSFDIIAGTSIGGICALGYATGMNSTQIMELLVDQGPTIFNGYFGLGPAGTFALSNVLTLPGANPVLYPNDGLKRALKSVLGTTKMFQAKTNVLITSFQYYGGTVGSDDSGGVIYPTGDYSNTYFPYGSGSTAVTAARPVNFSNVILPFTTGQNNTAIEVGLATSAAPVYFPPVQFSSAEDPTTDPWYIDGGLYQNNATAIAYTMAKVMFPGDTKINILSVGTGLTNVGFDIPVTSGLRLGPTNSLPMMGNLLSMNLGGAQEAVHQQFKYISLYNGVNENLNYYRFQTRYPTNFNAALDNVQPGFDTALIDQANVQYAKDKFQLSFFVQNAGF